jgi:hypothetical protein
MTTANERNKQALQIVQQEFHRADVWVADQVYRTGGTWCDFVALGYGTRSIDLRIPFDPELALTAHSPLHQYVQQLAPQVDAVAVIEKAGIWQVELTSIDRPVNDYHTMRADVPQVLALFDKLWSDGALPSVLRSDVADLAGLLHFTGRDSGAGLV